MTVQYFILLYNDTFKYMRDNYGVDSVNNLWKEISEEWCIHLDELVRDKGLEGMMEYWGGNDGTLSREKALFDVTLKDDVFRIDMYDCPSVGEIVNAGEDPMQGNLTYCDHCPALYVPIAEKYGYQMDYVVDYLPSDDGKGKKCSGKCHLTATKKE